MRLGASCAAAEPQSVHVASSQHSLELLGLSGVIVSSTLLIWSGGSLSLWSFVVILLALVRINVMCARAV